MLQEDENLKFFLAVLKLLINVYEEDGCDSITISKLKALLEHYDLA